MNQSIQLTLKDSAHAHTVWALSATFDKEERPLRPVTIIEARGAVEVVFFRSDSSQLVVAGEDQEAIRNTKTTIDGNKLIIKKEDHVRKGRFSWLFRQNRQNHRSSRVIVGIALPEVPSLISVNGSGEMTLYGILQPSLYLSVSGSGAITAFGQVEDLRAEVGGSGSVNTSELMTIAAKLSVDGSGSIDAQGGVNVKAHVAGSGGIVIRGNPLTRKHSVAGSGEIKFTSK